MDTNIMKKVNFSQELAFDIKQETADESINHNYINNNNNIKTEQFETLLMKQCFVIIEKCPSLDSTRRNKLK